MSEHSPVIERQGPTSACCEPSGPLLAEPTPAARVSVEIEPRLHAEGVHLGYPGRPVVHDLTLAIPPGEVSIIVGGNACGKSTVLRGLSRLLAPQQGRVILDGTDIHRLPTKEVARRVGLLPQAPTTPEGITVAELVARGRYPHQRWFQQWSAHDERALAQALDAVGMQEFAGRAVDELSGGQRQRVWIALALAQQTPLLLLDEPTTYLDIAHQVEVLDLLAELNESRGTTVVMVLHELNLAARYADHIVAMRDGEVLAQGPPSEVLTAQRVREVFGIEALILTDPASGAPLVVPQGRRHARKKAEHS